MTGTDTTLWLYGLGLAAKSVMTNPNIILATVESAFATWGAFPLGFTITDTIAAAVVAFSAVPDLTKLEILPGESLSLTGDANAEISILVDEVPLEPESQVPSQEAPSMQQQRIGYWQ